MSTLARATGVVYRSSTYERTEDDEVFTATFEDVFRETLERGFYTTIAGTSHRNSDRTSRTRIIGQCEVGERLSLEHESTNPYDQNAVAISRLDGSQLGYLHADTAEEVVESARKGKAWLAFFRRPTYHPDTLKLVGAVVLLLRMAPESASKDPSRP